MSFPNIFLKSVPSIKRQSGTGLGFNDIEGNNIRGEKSWDKGMTQPIKCLESNLSLDDFSKYGNVVISLWVYNDKIEIALALLKYELNKDFDIKEDKLTEKDNKDWYILFKETHNFKDGIINIDECVKEAESLIKEFKEKQNTFFILK